MSSIPPNSPWRGCAAFFPQPVSESNQSAAQFLTETVYYFNCRVINPPLDDIECRSSDGEQDILRHVFRWDTAPYQHVFQHGFEARRQGGTPDEIYFNLDHYVHHSGRPLDSTRPATHVFISTTLSSAWYPTLPDGTQEVYRYEIYAPGGIWVAETLGDRYRYPAQDEVAFVAGIAPQYIRSAQLFRLTHSGRYTRRERVDNRLIVNRNYNPQSHPSRVLPIQRPVFDYILNGRRELLNLVIYNPNSAAGANDNASREKREVSYDVIDWYTDKVADVGTYINAAFQSARNRDEVYLFMKNEYVLVNYAPGTTNDRVINGPLLICDGFPSLTDTAFAEFGVDCAFRSHHGNEAFIFSGNLCARIDYAPGTLNDKILRGPMPIGTMFPFFKRTVFETSIDAAFEATATNEAYLFKDDQYALIDYSEPRRIAIRKITEGFYSLRGTIFESGIDAAFASSRKNEAYLFKGDQYALINFAPGTTNDYIIGGVKPILPSWPSLRNILPRKNRGLDIHEHSHNTPEPDRDRDDL